ncbi:MAG: FecR family protein [Calditerrivibrio sp.]|nr:FecR family protein [Calditerrivibrio sp.]
MRIFITLFLFLVFTIPSFSETIGKVRNINGNVIVLRDNKELDVKLGFNILNKDQIITKNKSGCGIVFKDNTMITLDENTHYIVQAYQYDPKKSTYELKGELKTGKILFNSGKIPKIAANNVGIKTSSAVVGVKGTKFIVEASQ